MGEIRLRSKVDDLIDDCIAAVEAGRQRVSFSVPRCWGPPDGWPPVELMRDEGPALVYSAPAGDLLDVLLGS